MKFINRYSHKAWNDKSGQTQIRLLNYLFGFIIVISFWSIGQVVNSPSGEAWGNILRIGQLPIWLTMCSNNNNNNYCQECEIIKNALDSAIQEFETQEAIFNQLVEDHANACKGQVTGGLCLGDFANILAENAEEEIAALALLSAVSLCRTTGFGCAFIYHAAETYYQSVQEVMAAWDAYNECLEGECAQLRADIFNQAQVVRSAAESMESRSFMFATCASECGYWE